VWSAALLGVGHDDIFLYGLELIFKWFNEEVKIFVDKKNAVLGVINDVNQIFNGKTDIKRMQNSAMQGTPKLKFHMAMVVQSK